MTRKKIAIRMNEQKKIRSRLAVLAAAYELYDVSLVSDEEYDQLSTQVRLNVHTGHKVLDEWFRDNYQPDTGMWIHGHPDLPRIRRIVEGIL